MSELVRKVHSLKKEVFDLQEVLRSWKGRYASEVNHAEDLARSLQKVHHPCDRPICDICDLLDVHEQRRQGDMGAAWPEIALSPDPAEQ